jgi:hypothetical protein
MHLPSCEYLQSLVDRKNPRKGTVDTIFDSKEDATERLRAKIIYETEFMDVDEPVFMWCHYEIEEHEGEPPAVPLINNAVPEATITNMSVKELMESSKIKRELMIGSSITTVKFT